MLKLDGDGRIEAANRAFERVFGYREAEVAGRDVDELLAPPEEVSRARQWTRRACRGRAFRHTTRRRTRSDGWREVELQLLPRGSGEEAEGAFVVLHDLSERKSLETELRQARKMEALGHLTGGIAHDFNNLLTVILGYAEMLELVRDVRPEVAANAREIRRAAERAGELTTKLLTFGRRQEPAPTSLHLNTVVLELERVLQRMIGEKIRIETDLDVDLGLVRIDRVQLEQVIFNLAVNARDAMPKGGLLRLETFAAELDAEAVRGIPACRPGRFAVLRVRDNGCGMDETILERIFEPFFTTKEPGKGTGLGLASVQGIVSQHGGFVRVDSEPGVGTVFEVGLPEAGDARVDRLRAEASGRLATGHETILVVEDDTRVRSVTREVLELSGYEVLEAASAAEAVRRAETHQAPIHLLLTDVVMPDTDGPELARRLTAQRPEMKVLYQSGYADDASLRQGDREGSWGFVQKPVRQKLMTQKVRQILDS